MGLRVRRALLHRVCATGDKLQAVRVAVATVNSVAVRPALRGKAVTVANHARTMTAGKAQMVELSRRLDHAGAEVVLLTTSPGIAAVFFDHLGYYLIDPPFHSLDRALINMGLCVHDSDHFKEIGSPLGDLEDAAPAGEAERRCIAHFRARSAEILRGKPMEEFCRAELAHAAASAGALAK